MSPAPAPNDEVAERRKRARRTALLIGAIAVAVYVGFLLMGVLGGQ